MVMPPEYADESLINYLMYGKTLYVGRDGSIVTEGDFVYDVQNRRTCYLQYCGGHHCLRFHANEGSTNHLWSSAPCIFTTCNHHVYPYDLILLKSECSYPTYQTRVGPVAKLLGRALLKVRRKRHTMQVVAEVARSVSMQAAQLAQMMCPFLD